MPHAYFITFTTYGTWLHGSAKGSADREHHVYGAPYLEPDPARERQMQERMLQPEYTLSPPERDIVCRAIVDLANEKGWRLLAAHVRCNHVHVVVSANREPGRIMSDVKARASRDLTRAGFDSAKRRRWTRHGSRRHLFDEEHVAAAIHYTLDGQGERMACYAREPRTQ